MFDVVVAGVVLEVRDIDCDCWLSNYGVLRGAGRREGGSDRAREGAKGDGAGPVN